MSAMTDLANSAHLRKLKVSKDQSYLIISKNTSSSSLCGKEGYCFWKLLICLDTSTWTKDPTYFSISLSFESEISHRIKCCKLCPQLLQVLTEELVDTVGSSRT